MRIAVVDDDYTSRTNLKYFLEDEGYEVSAVDRPEALTDLSIYDAFVMDVWIRTETDPTRGRYAGIDFILKSKQEGKIPPPTPVLFISNFGSDPNIQERLKLLDSRTYYWIDKFDIISLGGLLFEIKRNQEA